MAEPVVIIPGGLNRFVLGKVTATAIAAVLAWSAGATGRLPRWLAGVTSIGCTILILAAATSASPYAAFFGRGPRYEGVFVIGTYVAALTAGARLLGPDGDIRVLTVALRVLAAASIVIAVIAIAEAAGARPLSTNVSRPGSLLGNASDEGAFGVLASPILIHYGWQQRDRWVLVGGGAAIAVTVLSGSRGALGALLVTALLLGVVLRRRRTVTAAVLAAIVVVGASFALPSTRGRILEQTPFAASTVSGRHLLWSESSNLVADHPVLGVGPSGFEVAILAEHDDKWQRQVGPASPVDSPHNWLLQAGASGGIPLALLALSLAIAVAVHGWRRASADRDAPSALTPSLFAAVIGYGVLLSVHLTSAGPTCLAAFFVGALMSRSPAREVRLVLSRVASSACALVAIVLGAGAIAEIPLRSGIVAAGTGMATRANHDFMIARALRPWDVDLPLQAGHALIAAAGARHDADELSVGLRWLGRIPGSLKDDEQYRLDRASACELAGDFGCARATLDRALADDHDNPLILLRRGVVEAEQHDNAAAELDFTRAAEISPKSPEPWRDLAILYDQEGKQQQANAAQQQAQALSR